MTDEEILGFALDIICDFDIMDMAHRKQKAEKVEAGIHLLMKQRDDAIIRRAAWELEAKILRIKLAKAVEALRVISQFKAVTTASLNIQAIWTMTERAHATIKELEKE